MSAQIFIFLPKTQSYTCIHVKFEFDMVNGPIIFLQKKDSTKIAMMQKMNVSRNTFSLELL